MKCEVYEWKIFIGCNFHLARATKVLNIYNFIKSYFKVEVKFKIFCALFAKI